MRQELIYNLLAAARFSVMISLEFEGRQIKYSVRDESALNEVCIAVVKALHKPQQAV